MLKSKNIFRFSISFLLLIFLMSINSFGQGGNSLNLEGKEFFIVVKSTERYLTLKSPNFIALGWANNYKQKFKFKKLPGGAYHIIQPNGNYMKVKPDGQGITHYRPNPGYNPKLKEVEADDESFQWKIQKANNEDYYFFISVLNNKRCKMTPPKPGDGNGAPLVLASGRGSQTNDHQKFKLIDVNTKQDPPGNTALKFNNKAIFPNAKHSKLPLDAHSFNMVQDDGRYWKSSPHYFKYKLIGRPNGNYLIKSERTNRYAQVVSGSKLKFSKVSPETKNLAFQWKIQAAGANYYYIVSALNGNRWSIVGGSKAPGALVELKNASGKDYQKFKFEYAPPSIHAVNPITGSYFPFINEDEKPGSITRTVKGNPKKWLVEEGHTNRWMGYLGDDTRLRRMSIPATHHAASHKVGGLHQTMAWNIREQLDAGVRWMEFRLALKEDGKLIPVHAGLSFKYTLDEIYTIITEFLNENPSETVIADIGVHKGSAVTSNSLKSNAKFLESWNIGWNKIMSKHGDKIYAPDYPNEVDPTLGQLRGKIYQIRRNVWWAVPRNGFLIEYNPSIGPGILDSIVAENDLIFHHHKKDKKDDHIYRNEEIAVQEHYSLHYNTTRSKKAQNMIFPHIRVDDKRTLIRLLVDKARNPNTGNEYYNRWIHNSVTGSTPLPPKVSADELHDFFYYSINHTGIAQRLGVIWLDYPGEKLVYRIIKSNFTF